MARTIGIITNDQNRVFQAEVIEGIREIADDQHYDTHVQSLADGQEISLNQLVPLSGVIVVANVLPDAFIRDIYQLGKPISLVSHFIKDTPIPAVIPNNAQGIAKLVEHLVVNCHRRKFVYINGDLDQYDGQERRTAFLKELVRFDLETSPDYLLQGNFEPSIARASLQSFVETNADFDAVIAADYLMALEAVDVLSESQFRVPEDVSVVGFGDSEVSQKHELTTIAADIKELGRRGTRQLIGQINNLQIRGTTLLTVNLEVRATCGFQTQKQVEK